MTSVSKTNLSKVAYAMSSRHRGLKLEGIPHWVTPDDVRRMAERAKAEGIVDVRLHSEDGLPTGQASIEFRTPLQTKKAALLLDKAQISAIPIRVVGYEHAFHKLYSKGKMTPFGLHEPAKPPATTIIYGFPKKFSVADVRDFLDDYRLSIFGTPREAFADLMCSGKQSRWAIGLNSLSDAHRLVRHLHKRRFTLGDGVETTLGARVLY